jgi:hypothetical protein
MRATEVAEMLIAISVLLEERRGMISELCINICRHLRFVP